MFPLFSCDLFSDFSTIAIRVRVRLHKLRVYVSFESTFFFFNRNESKHRMNRELVLMSTYSFKRIMGALLQKKKFFIFCTSFL